MLKILRESKFAKVISVYLSLNFLLNNMGIPSFALTGGPSQPEVQSFEPITTTQMVDPFSGDFSYNIPLIDVGGYPINLSYHSGISMDQEASWVGLGWNINPGVINRNMRGLPDDFKEDKVVKSYNIKSDQTFGTDLGGNLEIFGLDTRNLGLDFNFSLGMSYNTYRGIGITSGISPALKFGKTSKSQLTASLDLTSGTDGFGIQPNLSFSQKINSLKDTEDNLNVNIGIGYNSRAGLSELSFGLNFKNTGTEFDKGSDDFGYFTGQGTIYTFSSPTIVPEISMPLQNYSATATYKYGTEIFGADANIKFGIHYFIQMLAQSQQEMNSYGYMYSEYGTDAASLHDFNRENDGPFNEHIPNLPVTNYTYDVYSLSGQGIGGVYRPYRNDIGILHDHYNTNSSSDYSLGGFEFGAGNGVHVSLNFDVNTTNTYINKWSDDNEVDDFLGFKRWDANDAGHQNYEPYTFAKAGELVPTTSSSNNIFNNFQKENPVRIQISNDAAVAKQVYENSEGNTENITENINSSKKKKNENIQVLTNGEASLYGTMKKINEYPLGTYIMNPYSTNSGDLYKMNALNTTIRNTTNGYKSHHIGEIEATTLDGKKYLYSIPAQNKVTKEVTFAVNGEVLTPSTDFDGMVYYAPGSDNSVDNEKGLDHYFNKTETPTYSHSYLLNAILSVDYADVDGIEGPSDNDLGSYTLFNYSKVSSNYKWRAPLGANESSHNPGLYSKSNDDKGSYIYGEKEIWYLHSIETKTHIAVFELDERIDSKPVANENGSVDNSNNVMKKLKSIKLYSKQEVIQYYKEGHTGDFVNGGVIPLKTVEFVYADEVPEYENQILCPGTLNSIGEKGKLTLKEVKFKYRDSQMSSQNAYVFEYGQFWTDEVLENQEIMNPTYSTQNYDRWGNYSVSSPDPEYSNARSQEFIYTDQGKISSTNEYVASKYIADRQAASWNLTTINLPSGSKINIEYESDDYAFVQDKKAMQMFNVIGVASSDAPSTLTNKLYLDGDFNGDYNNLYLFVNYPAGIEINNSTDVQTKLLKDHNNNPINDLFFKFYLKTGPGIKVTGEDHYEYVSGYAKVDVSNSGYNPALNCAFIKLRSVEIADPRSALQVHPISHAGWNFAQLYLPEVAYGSPDFESNLTQVFDALATQATSIIQSFIGINMSLMLRASSQIFIPGKSWIRLYNPNGKKKGGGNRVKKIIQKDTWEGKNVAYGQAYEYKTKDNNGNDISSGVASYEPLLGGEENPFKQPDRYDNHKVWAPSQEYYQESPYGESFFPAALVGYSKVIVKNLKININSSNPIVGNAPGFTEHRFYTAFDFPTITKKTLVDYQRFKPNFLKDLFGLHTTDYYTATQGFYVELNNMHGQPKSQKTYGLDENVPINGIEFNYLLKDNNTLNNTVKTISKSGNTKTVEEMLVGVDYDFVLDMREHTTSVSMTGVSVNIDFFMAGIFPVIVPTAFPQIVSEETRFRSSVATKVINKVGILSSVTAIDNSSRVTAENLLWDSETGQVLLTKTYNEYDDAYYTFSYPAHWEYDGMGLAYKNLGYKAKIDILTDGKIVDNNLVEGDVLILNGSQKAWVIKSAGELHLIYSNGNFVPQESDVNIKVIKSGRTNTSTVSIGNVVCKNNPLSGTGTVSNPYTFSIDNSKKIISASATYYTEEASMFCNCNLPSPSVSVYNPYLYGKKGIWKPKSSWAYLTERTQKTDLKNNFYKTDTRNNGVYTSFDEFDWQFPTGNNWTKMSEISKFATQGMELESVDALGIYSAATFGYNFTKPTAVVKNAMYREIGFDSFEDYIWRNCQDNHFSFMQSITPFTVTDTESHSGKKSAVVAPNTKVNVTKKVKPCN